MVDIDDAVRNVENTSRKVINPMMSHSCLSSPTAGDRRMDMVVAFVYPPPRPILNSLIWPDKIVRYPIAHSTLPP